MPEMIPLSLTLEQIRDIKTRIVHGASYSDRVSLGFAARLLQVRDELGEDRAVLREIDALEGPDAYSMTKKAEQFSRPPLFPFWHKHFSTPRHLFRNIGIRWGADKSGNRDLTKMIEKAEAKYGHEPELWQKYLAYQFVMGGYQERAASRRMTGDWIIFAKHEGKNFYLDMATHEEAQEPDRLMKKLWQGSAAEFSFLFRE